MKFTEKLRNIIFFQKDKWNGSLINNHLNDLTQWPKSQTLKTRLTDLLERATKTTGFYQNYDVSKGMESFPIINKSMMKNNKSDFLSSSYKKVDLIRRFTSGSTGTPFGSYQNKNKKKRNTADTVFFGSLAGYEAGTKLHYLKVWSQNNSKGKIEKIAQNLVPVEVLNLDKNAEKWVRRWNNEKSTINMLRYVSAFETIINWLEQHKDRGITAKVNSIITMSECLSKESRTAIAKHFKTNVFARYSNIENGIIAQQVPGSGDSFLINSASYYVEIIDLNSDQILRDNQLGRIVVTDLYNQAMPFIRYDTGDLGIKSKKTIEGREYEVLSRIEGRKLDQIFNTKREAISSYVVYKNMWQYPEITQYQLIQRDVKGYLIKICIQGEFQQEDLLLSQFKKYLGRDANISLEYVDEIPLLSSGKRKKVVNLMTNS